MNPVKLPPARGPLKRLLTPSRFAGPLSACLSRNQPADAADFERRWHRAQMRGWAGHWRESRVEAAMLGKPVDALAALNLRLAVVYRDATKRATAKLAVEV